MSSRLIPQLSNLPGHANSRLGMENLVLRIRKPFAENAREKNGVYNTADFDRPNRCAGADSSSPKAFVEAS
jgi:hypothetical protein